SNSSSRSGELALLPLLTLTIGVSDSKVEERAVYRVAVKPFSDKGLASKSVFFLWSLFFSFTAT
ncbi:MAG: hypothetical protein AAGC68_10880, partial [Verrucomicrobiota bacterium]